MDDNLEQHLIHLLNQRTRLIAKEVNGQLKAHGLYSSQWSIIYCINRFGPMTLTGIWQYLNVEAPTVTRTVTRMENKGWVVRGQGEDKRERVIALTPMAKEKFSEVRQTMNRLEHDVLADLSKNEKEQLQTLLSKIQTTGANNN